MKLELLVLAITAFLVFNTYSDGKYLKLAQGYTKYAKMAMFAFGGLSVYLFLKKYPTQSQSVLAHASDIVKYMPVSKGSTDFLSPFLDFSNKVPFSSDPSNASPQYVQQQQMEQRIMSSGKNNATKRSVSETKKKFVASQQGWTCNKCKNQLPAWFEVDHITRLEYGGSNHVDNLEALCRDCHGRKTAMENL